MSKKKTSKKKSATDRVVEIVIRNPEVDTDGIASQLKKDGLTAKPTTVQAQAFHTKKILRVLDQMGWSLNNGTA